MGTRPESAALILLLQDAVERAFARGDAEDIHFLSGQCTRIVVRTAELAAASVAEGKNATEARKDN